MALWTMFYSSYSPGWLVVPSMLLAHLCFGVFPAVIRDRSVKSGVC